MRKKRSGVEETLEALAALEGSTDLSAVTAQLTKALERKNGLIVARAAQVCLARSLESLTPKLIKALERLLDAEPKADLGCRAKREIIKALNGMRTSAEAAEALERAMRHVQLEPVWGGKEDTAPELRGLAAKALVRINHPEIMLLLADLLADKSKVARILALSAIAESGRPDGLALLRYKANIGDGESEVVTESLLSLLYLDPGQLDFVARRLDDQDELRFESAALALGQSRLQSAFGALSQRAHDALGNRRKVLLLSIAMLRMPLAWDYLESRVAKDQGGGAQDALEALALARYDEALVARLKKHVQAREERKLSTLFQELFG